MGTAIGFSDNQDTVSLAGSGSSVHNLYSAVTWINPVGIISPAPEVQQEGTRCKLQQPQKLSLDKMNG